MPAQEFLKGAKVFLAGFAQHPAGGLVDQVLGVMEEDFGEREGIVDVTVANEPPGGDDGDAAIPEARRFRQFIEKALVAGEEPGADDVGRAVVHTVPVADETAVAQVEAKNLFLASFAGFQKLNAQDHVGQRTFVVNNRSHELADVGQGEMREFLRDFARRCGGDAEEGVTSAVLEEAALGSRSYPI